MREIDRRTETETDSRIDSYLFSWPYSVIKAPLSSSTSRLEGCLSGDPLQRGAQPFADSLRDWSNLFWPQISTGSRLTVLHVGISIYHFITPTHYHKTTWVLLLIYIDVRAAKPLIDGSVKGQYTTLLPNLFFKMSTCRHFVHVPLDLSPHPYLTKNVQVQQQHNTAIITHLWKWLFNHVTINTF